MGTVPPRPPVASPPIRWLLIPVLGDVAAHYIANWSDKRAYDLLKIFVGPVFDEPFEHVAVLYEGHRRDMFVGETSSINGRHIRNIRATAIYRANVLTRAPGTDPESLPSISGPAVLFPDTIVWF